MKPTKQLIEHSLAILDDITEELARISNRMIAAPNHELTDTWAMDRELLLAKKRLIELWLIEQEFDI